MRLSIHILSATRLFTLAALSVALIVNRQAQAADDPIDAQAATETMPYTPLNRASVTDLYESAYAMVIPEVGGAFDYEKLSRELYEANLHRWEVVDGQPEPPDGPGKTEWLAHRSADRLALANKIAAIGYAADQRAATLAETLRNRVLGLRAELKVARSTLDTQLAAVVAEAQENFWFPSTLALYTWGDFTENWLFGNPFYNDWMGFWIPPADNYAQMAGFLAGVEADRDDLLAYNARIASAYSNYQAALDEADRTLREIFAMGTQDFQVLERGSDGLLYLWSMTNCYAGKMDLVLDELPLTAEVVRPELLTARFDPDRAISMIRARMSELQADYDLDQLQKGLALASLRSHGERPSGVHARRFGWPRGNSPGIRTGVAYLFQNNAQCYTRRIRRRRHRWPKPLA